MLQCRGDCAPEWICSFIFCDSVFICSSLNSLCVYWQLPDKCIATAKRDKPCCNSLLIASVFHLKQTLNHGNQQFMQRSEISGFQKLRSAVTLHWNIGNHSSAFHVSVTVRKMWIWQSPFGKLGTDGKMLVAFKKQSYLFFRIIWNIFSTNSPFL